MVGLDIAHYRRKNGANCGIDNFVPAVAWMALDLFFFFLKSSRIDWMPFSRFQF